ncbi:MAG: helix-turn-helix transcriptional regulator [Peptococcaceae bacterium]
MDKEELINIVSEKIKILRTERDLTQQQMAEILGISKKTLVQIEKKRIAASWTTLIAVCALFRNSSILQDSLGGDPLELVEVTAWGTFYYPKEKTLGGKIWWKELKSTESFTLQQNILSKHYRILDKNNRRWASSFEYDAIVLLFERFGKNDHFSDD